MKILVFGNPLVEKDSLVLRILPGLRKKFPKIDFLEVEPTEDLGKFGKNLVILDAVANADDVVMIDSIEQLETNKIHSMHDFDLAYNLKILKKLGLIETVKIIGVPMNMDEEEAIKKTGNLLLNIIST